MRGWRWSIARRPLILFQCLVIIGRVEIDVIALALYLVAKIVVSHPPLSEYIVPIGSFSCFIFLLLPIARFSYLDEVSNAN